MTHFLASVTTLTEALAAVAGGANIIDCKDPSRGALGALPVATVAAIRAGLPRHILVSATIGDLPADPAEVTRAVQSMAQSGADIVKIGFFPGGDPRATIRALGVLNVAPVRLAGLLLADCEPDFDLIDDMAEAGFVGVMLDTAIKANGALRDHQSPAQLSQFVRSAQNRGLFAGFAGSLGLSDIAPLMRLKPNVLGFRGALCTHGVRTGPLDADAVRAVAALMREHGRDQPATHPALKTGTDR